MSLEYYLFCKEKYELMIRYLDRINELNDEIIMNSKYNSIKIDENFNDFHIISSLPKTRENLLQLKKMCDKHIFELCKHEYIDDLIDVDPDKSLHITYCKLCGYTK